VSVLDYVFRNPELRQRALTHKSASAAHNERLEFLGDALVNLFMAEALYRQFPDATEGQLSRLRSSVVQQSSLAQVARRLCLGEEMRLGTGEQKSGGRQRESLLADALEAVVAAVYLDSDYVTCRTVVLRWFDDVLRSLTLEEDYKDPKSRLQEWVQARGMPLPDYLTVSESGPDNARCYEVLARLATLRIEATGRGSSKKQAEQDAASHLLRAVQERR